MELLAANRRHVLVAGLTGTGKSVSVSRGLLATLDPSKYVTVTLQFSARTSEVQTQAIIDGRMMKRRVGVYGPPLGKRAVVFVDGM